jgi:hypothetical protein
MAVVTVVVIETVGNFSVGEVDNVNTLEVTALASATLSNYSGGW